MNNDVNRTDGDNLLCESIHDGPLRDDSELGPAPTHYESFLLSLCNVSSFTGLHFALRAGYGFKYLPCLGDDLLGVSAPYVCGENHENGRPV